MEQSTSLEANSARANQRYSPHFMKNLGSLPYLKEAATCPCPEIDQSRS